MAGADGHWLDRYGNGYYDWKPADHNGPKTFERPIGLVETSFDSDGRSVFTLKCTFKARLTLCLSTGILAVVPT
jgi:hypothetical protein